MNECRVGHISELSAYKCLMQQFQEIGFFATQLFQHSRQLLTLKHTSLLNTERSVSHYKRHRFIIIIIITDCLHGLLPGPFLRSYSVFDFHFSLFFRFCAVR